LKTKNEMILYIDLYNFAVKQPQKTLIKHDLVVSKNINPRVYQRGMLDVLMFSAELKSARRGPEFNHRPKPFS